MKTAMKTVMKEPAYFRLFVEGEQVVGCDYRGSYVHRGIEKLGDSVLTYIRRAKDPQDFTVVMLNFTPVTV